MSFDREKLRTEIRQAEKYVRHAYQDSKGLWTIGYGRLIDKKMGGGITKSEADYLLDHDIDTAVEECDSHIPWWRNLDPVRQRALVELMFNMGWGGGKRGLSTFHNTLAAIEANEYAKAGQGLRKSKWARDVKTRAPRLIKMIETGEDI